MQEVAGSDVWSFIEKWHKDNKRLINSIFRYHAFKRGDEYEDVFNEILLITYEIVVKYLEETSVKLEDFTSNDISIINSKVFGIYRSRSWKESLGYKSAKNVVGKDYDDFIEDGGLGYLIFAEQEEALKAPIFEEELDDNYLEDLLKLSYEKKILTFKEYDSLLKQTGFSEGYGALKQYEIAEILSCKRTTVNKRIKGAIKKLTAFIQVNNINLHNISSKIEDIANGLYVIPAEAVRKKQKSPEKIINPVVTYASASIFEILSDENLENKEEKGKLRIAYKKQKKQKNNQYLTQTIETYLAEIENEHSCKILLLREVV